MSVEKSTVSVLADWSDFVRWVINEHPDKFPGDIAHLSDSAAFVDTQRAAIAALVASGMRVGDVVCLGAQWLRESCGLTLESAK